MSETPDSIPLCRFEELVRRENWQRAARASGSVASPKKLSAADDLKCGGVDILDRLSGRELGAAHLGNGVGRVSFQLDRSIETPKR
jgi:hypothetical protein